ncbi:MAG TPA: hypothetical protein VN963_09820 [bacterium]|nr:hypothetical protein [bacterium]
METTPPPEEKPEKLETHRVEKLAPSQQEVFEGRIDELEEENKKLKAENEELRKPKTVTKKKGFTLGDWIP